jgi:hypothetical protein
MRMSLLNPPAFVGIGSPLATQFVTFSSMLASKMRGPGIPKAQCCIAETAG